MEQVGTALECECQESHETYCAHMSQGFGCQPCSTARTQWIETEHSRHERRLRVKQVAAGVLVFLVVLGIGAARQQHRVPTDAYGYTAAERQALVSGFVSGLGSGTTAACLADAFE